jgi:hypothetical protein
MDEINLTGDYIDPKTAIQRGQIAGAQYIIQVTMQKPDVVNVRTGIPLASIMGAAQAISGTNIGAQYASNMQVGTLKAEVSISTRVVDLQTGEVVFMSSGTGKAKGKSQLAMEYGALGGGEINGGAQGFKQTITGKAIQQAFMGIGRNLNEYFKGNTQTKVMGTVSGGMRYGDQLYLKGRSLYLGTEKLNKEGVKMAFADNPDLFFRYKQAKSQIGWSWVTTLIGSGIMLMSSAWDLTYERASFVGTFIAGAGIAGGGIYLNISGTKKLKRIEMDYNASQSQSYHNNRPRVDLALSKNGLGLRFTF